MGYVACGSAFERPRIYRTSMYVCEETSIAKVYLYKHTIKPL